jgi:cytochrome c-type biogenesis protein CcmH/NrfF
VPPRSPWGLTLPVVPVVMTLALACGSAAGASKADVDLVGEQLVCYCGCSGLTVKACTCGTADGIREKINGQLDSGLAPDEVVAVWVEERGEQVLAVPTREGFNLVGWFLPFVVTLLGLAAAAITVVRWQKKAAAQSQEAEADDVDMEYLSRVDQDVEKLNR